MLAGCLILVGGLAAGGWLRGRREAVAPLNEPALRAAMAAAPAAEVHASWLVFEREGLVRPPLVEEQRRLASARAIAGLEWIAWLTAAVGAAVATGAALLSGRSPRRSAASRA